MWFLIWQEFGEFSRNHSKVWKLLFDGLFLSKVYKVQAIKIQRSYLSWHWTVMQNLNKPWPCCFKNGMRNWVNFHIARKCVDVRHFSHAPLRSKLVPMFLSSRSRQKKFTHSPRPHSFENLFPPTGRRWLGTLGFLYFLWFAIFSTVMALQFCK